MCIELDNPSTSIPLYFPHSKSIDWNQTPNIPPKTRTKSNQDERIHRSEPQSVQVSPSHTHHTSIIFFALVTSQSANRSFNRSSRHASKSITNDSRNSLVTYQPHTTQNHGNTPSQSKSRPRYTRARNGSTRASSGLHHLRMTPPKPTFAYSTTPAALARSHKRSARPSARSAASTSARTWSQRTTPRRGRQG